MGRSPKAAAASAWSARSIHMVTGQTLNMASVRESTFVTVASIKAGLTKKAGFHVPTHVHVHQHQVNLKETCSSGSLHCPTASTNFTGRYGVLVQRARKFDRLFDLSCGFRAKHFSNGENHSCMKFLAKDFNHPKLVACFKMMNYQAIFKNGINARLLGKLFQQAIVMFRRNVDEYFHGIRASNPVNSAQCADVTWASSQ